MDKQFDIIIYGATGFTGSLCVKYLKNNYSDIRWAIAGRDKKKLSDLLSLYSLDCGLFIADGDDDKALDRITKQATIVLSTAGPFHRYGTKLVQSCIRNESHYVDITGETFWIRDLIDRCHEDAKNKKLRIVPSCGFDSVPSDIGCFYASREFNGKIKSIHSFYKWKGEASGGTIETMFASGIRKKSFLGPFGLNPKNTISENQKRYTSDKIGIEKNKDINSWTGPFIMAIANANIVRRSAALFDMLGEGYGENFIYKEHAYYSNRFKAIFGTFLLALFGIAIFTPFRRIVRPFLRKPGQGPSKKVMDEGFFKGKFVVTGLDNTKKLYEVYGKGDPGYKLTSMFACESAISILKGGSNLPGGESFGGILTASSGMGNVLLDRLKKAGIIFKVSK